jgi:hypothetical protein
MSAEQEAEIEKVRLTAEANIKREEVRKIQAEIELQKENNRLREIELEAETKRIEMQHALEVKQSKLQAQASKTKKESDESEDEEGSSVRSRRGVRPKLPLFDDSKEQIDAYLLRFEKYATAQKWSKDSWASSLSALLKGEALNVYYRLPDTEYDDYTALKKALLKRYQLTEDGFRSKFRSAKPEKGESFMQFVTRLNMYLTRWIEMSETDETYESLRDLLLREQALNIASHDLRIFLKERKPKNIQEMAMLAEQYLEVHGRLYDYWSAGNKKNQQNRKDSNYEKKPDMKEVSIPNQNIKRQQYEADKEKRACFLCHKSGHFAHECKSRPTQVTSMHAVSSELPSEDDFVVLDNGWKLPVTTENGEKYIKIKDQSIKMKSAISLESDHYLPHVTGRFGSCGSLVSVMRDTGSNGVIVKESLCGPGDFVGTTGVCTFVDGSEKVAPVVNVYIDSPFFTGRVRAMAMKSPFFDVILGNIPGVRNASDPDPEWSLDKAKAGGIACGSVSGSMSGTDKVASVSDMVVKSSLAEVSRDCFAGELSQNKPGGFSGTSTFVGQVVTRGQARKTGGLKPLKVAEPSLLQVDRTELIQMQEKDASLDKIRAVVGQSLCHKKLWQEHYYVKNGVLCREHTSTPKTGKRVTKQVVLPKSLREGVMEVAHDSILGGHLGSQKSVDRVLSSFYWPGIVGDMKRFCASCDVCQRTTPKGRIGKVPLGVTPMVDVPFSRVAIDLVGPLPVSERGHRYILTLVDFATRYPEAVALKRIDTVEVAESLVSIFSRLGVPREILSDQGSQFTSDLMSEVSRLLSIKQLRTTPYHPQSNGLVERFHGVLKSMIKRMCDEKPKDWDRYVDPLLFAYREVPQEGIGFAPFEMLYGRTVRGPMAILKELWTGESVDSEVRSTYQYVLELRQRLEETCELAHQVLAQNKIKQKAYYDRKAHDRGFVTGDFVLLLLPTDNNKLLMQWKGPFKVISKVGDFDYRIDVNGKAKVFHANMLKKYHVREKTDGDVESANVIVTLDQEECEGEVVFCPLESTESLEDVVIDHNLSVEQQQEVKGLLEKFRSVFSDLPGKTNLVECNIDMVDETPIRQKPYPVPQAIREAMKVEVDRMQQMGIIEDSRSEFCSPSVMVKKSDGAHRYCIDFRRINSVSAFDSEPIPQQDQIIGRLGKSKYFTKIDLSKGFWQIPIAEKDRHKTAFATEEGLKQFVVMPFGLVNASSVFCRMMRKLLVGLDNVESYIDDVVVHTESWSEHLQALENLFSRLRECNLTARPSKCNIGCKEIDFLGHTLGGGVLRPQQAKVEGILNVCRPETKKELRSYLGMIGYHRKFIPNFASHASVLTNLLTKGQPQKIKWSPKALEAFDFFKEKLSLYPVLRLPDFNKEMTLAVDSSGTGLGAVLMQSHEGQLCPVLYLSRKLKPAETRYSAIERECLAVVWAIKALHPYLYGREFVLFSDHQPLSYLNSAKFNNGRVMRWAIDLQIYRFRVQVVKGSENNTADYLSRRGISE